MGVGGGGDLLTVLTFSHGSSRGQRESHERGEDSPEDTRNDGSTKKQPCLATKNKKTVNRRH